MKKIGWMFIVLLGGCAFKEVPLLVEPVKTPYEVAFDWPTEGSTHLGKELKAVRALNEGDSHHFEADRVVTIPTSVPPTLFLSAEIPAGAFYEDLRFSLGRVSLGNESFRVVTELLTAASGSADKRRVSVQVSGLNAILDKLESQTATLEIDLYGKEVRLTSFSVALRTPPSHLKVERVSIKEWRDRGDPSKASMLSPEIAGERINLVQTIRIENQESVSVEIQFPRRPAAQLFQNVNSMIYRDLGCNGAGFAIDQSPRQERFAEDIFVLPLNERLVPEAAISLKDRNLKDTVSVSIPAGDTLWLGIYAIGQKVTQWLDSGLAGPELTQITVPSSCHRECRESECFCPRCGLDQLPAKQQPLLCRCVSWQTNRGTETITIGMDRGPLILNVATEGGLVARFADVDFRQDGEIRERALLPSSLEVLWF